jgi:hypothetical protein
MGFGLLERLYHVITSHYEYKSLTDLHTLNVTLTIAYRKSSVSSPPVARKRGLTIQRKSYFRTGCLPPISSSWRQAPWRSRPEIILFTAEPLRSYSLSTILSDDRVGLSLMNKSGLSSSVRIAYIAYYSNTSFRSIHKFSVSLGFAKQIMSVLRILCYNGSLVTWMVYLLI